MVQHKQLPERCQKEKDPEGIRKPGNVCHAAGHGAGSPRLAPAGMYALQCPMELPACVWEVAEPVSQVRHLGTTLYGTFETYLGTFNVVPLRGQQCKREAHGLLEVLLQIFNFFFGFCEAIGIQKRKRNSFCS